MLDLKIEKTSSVFEKVWLWDHGTKRIKTKRLTSLEIFAKTLRCSDGKKQWKAMRE